MIAFTQPNLPAFTQLSLLGGQVKIDFCDIVFIEGQGNYTKFHTREGQRILTSKSLSFYREALPAEFLRVHKSYFVNSLFVKVFDKEVVLLTNEVSIPVSRRRRREIKLQTSLQKTNSSKLH